MKEIPRSDQWDSVKNGVCGDTNPVPIWTSVGIGYKNKNNNYADYAKLVNTVNSCSGRPS